MMPGLSIAYIAGSLVEVVTCAFLCGQNHPYIVLKTESRV